ATANDDAKLGFEVRPMVRKRDFDFAAIRYERSRCLDPDQRFLGYGLAAFAGMVGIVQTDGDNLRRHYRCERAHALELHRFSSEGWRAENIPAKPVDFAIHNFRVKNLVTLLKSANGCHKREILNKPPISLA